jgi:hypothetical protein
MMFTRREACFLSCDLHDHVPYWFSTMESFIYAKNNDGYLVTIRGDFAEMTKVDMERQVSKYIRLEAPVDHIRMSVKKLVSQGYKLSNRLELSWQRLIDA